jgi:hypothetical protein
LDRRRGITRIWIKLFDEELHTCTFHYFFIGVIKSRRTVLADHVERVEGMRNAYEFLDWKPVGKIQLCGLGIGGRILLKWVFKK